jgi:hypothetical protein
MTLVTKKTGKAMVTSIRTPSHASRTSRTQSAEAKLEKAIDAALDQMTPEQIEEAEQKTNALLAELRPKR